MKTVYTVGQVNAYVRNMFAQDFLMNALTVKGELSNVKYHGSGHIYFTLKDEKGAISCVMFAGSRAAGLKFQMSDGQKVLVSGRVDVYERGGNYQLYANRIQLDGEGDLYLQFAQLKKKLEEMGMFDAMYKKPIPKMIRTLGVVTAPTGAAVQDIINIATRRNPYVQIILYPALVQGDGAAASVVRGIRALEAQGVDVMIVGRGGGSIEDLWAFNEESVAQAVFNCSVPIISAVGHETDTTMIDYVSDLRAPTPSAAAELAVYEIAKLMESLDEYAMALRRRMQAVLERKKLQLRMLEAGIRRSAPHALVRAKREHAIWLEEQLEKLMERSILNARHKRDIYLHKLRGLSPLEKISRGFAYVSDAQGETVKSVKQLTVGAQLEIYLADGKVNASVDAIQEKDRLEA